MNRHNKGNWSQYHVSKFKFELTIKSAKTNILSSGGQECCAYKQNCNRSSSSLWKLTFFHEIFLFIPTILPFVTTKTWSPITTYHSHQIRFIKFFRHTPCYRGNIIVIISGRIQRFFRHPWFELWFEWSEYSKDYSEYQFQTPKFRDLYCCFA